MTTTEAKLVKRPRIPTTYIVALIPVAAALNIVGSTINAALRLPTFLDMIGTAGRRDAGPVVGCSRRQLPI